MELERLHVVDLSSIQGNGDFLCPKCGLRLSPDDETEDNYCLLGTTVINNILDELVIQCMCCKSKIRLIGFSVINSE